MYIRPTAAAELKRNLEFAVGGNECTHQYAPDSCSDDSAIVDGVKMSRQASAESARV